TTTSAATTTPNAIPNEPYDASPTTPTDSATPSASTPSKPHSSPTLLQSPLFSTQKDVKAYVRSPGTRANQRHCEVRTFATTTNALLELRDWLVEQKVTLVAMEATGDYWRPPFYVLEDDLNVILVNPAHAKGLPGRKSDVSDSMWLAQLGECGLLKASFVP